MEAEAARREEREAARCESGGCLLLAADCRRRDRSEAVAAPIPVRRHHTRRFSRVHALCSRGRSAGELKRTKMSEEAHRLDKGAPQFQPPSRDAIRTIAGLAARSLATDSVSTKLLRRQPQVTSPWPNRDSSIMVLGRDSEAGVATGFRLGGWTQRRKIIPIFPCVYSVRCVNKTFLTF